MSGLRDKTVSLAQGDGPPLTLVVSGTVLYATYETLDGYPVIYDATKGLWCYARVIDGAYVSTGVEATAHPLPDLIPHAQESPAVRAAKIAAREAEMTARAQHPSRTGDPL